jgi:hypothetical protein
MRPHVFLSAICSLLLLVLMIGPLRGQSYRTVQEMIDSCQNTVLRRERIAWTPSLLDTLARQVPKASEEGCMTTLLEWANADLHQEDGRSDFLVEAVGINGEQEKYFPQWLVKDARYQIEVLCALGIPDSIPAVVNIGKYQMKLVQDPRRGESDEKPDLLKLVLGSEKDALLVVEKTRLRSSLGEDLYSRLQDRNYAQEVTTASLGQKRTNYSSVRLSLLGAEAVVHRTAADFGIRLDLGKEAVGFPFYYGATWNISGVYRPYEPDSLEPSDAYELGIQVPFESGDRESNIFGPVVFRQRKLNGATGIIGRFKKQIFSASSVGGEFSVASLSERGDHTLVDESGQVITVFDNSGNPIPNDTTRPFLYMTGDLLVYYSRDLSSDILNGLSASVGLGYFQMREARLGGDYNTIKSLGNHYQTGPYFKLSYQHREGTEYAISLQYFNSSLLASAHLSVFDWLGLEAMYSRVLFRGLKSWEHRDLMALSPRLAFTFSF